MVMMMQARGGMVCFGRCGVRRCGAWRSLSAGAGIGRLDKTRPRFAGKPQAKKSPDMATLTIRKLEDEVVAALKARARRDRRSLEAGARSAAGPGLARIGDVSARSRRSDRRPDPERAAERQHGADPRRPHAMTLVVDASVAAKWFVAQDGREPGGRATSGVARPALAPGPRERRRWGGRWDAAITSVLAVLEREPAGAVALGAAGRLARSSAAGADAAAGLSA